MYKKQSFWASRVRLLIFLLGVLMVWTIQGWSQNMNNNVTSNSRIPSIRVGLLSDPGCTDERSREAAWKVLGSASDLSPRRITSAEIRHGGLSSIDVLMFPGGTGGGEAKALGVEGGKLVTEFVESGHGVVAVCAGGYLVVKGWNPETSAIELVNALSWDGEHWARGEAFITVKVLGVNDEESSRTMWFQNGPIFAPRGLKTMPEYTPLVRYVTDMAPKGGPKGMMTGRDAVIAAPFGKGRVAAFGPHPELSPGLNHWLINAVRWTAFARKDESTENAESAIAITADVILEGRVPAPLAPSHSPSPN
jgi:putative intracellular protease/amidase